MSVRDGIPNDGSYIDMTLDDGRRVVARALRFGTSAQTWRVEVFDAGGTRVHRGSARWLSTAYEEAGLPPGPEMLEQQIRRLRRMLEDRRSGT